MPSESLRFTCSKCHGNDCEIGEIRAADGSTLANLFDFFTG